MSFNLIYKIIGLPWLFLMLFTSRMYSEVKVIMLILLMFVCLCEIALKHYRITAKYKRYVVLFVIFSVISLIIGEINGFSFSIESDYSLIQYYILTPICILLFSTVFKYNEARKKYLWKILMYFTCALCILDVIRVALYMIGIDPPFLSFIMMASGNSTLELALRVSNEIALFFLLPIYVYLFINPDSEKKTDKFIYFLIVIFGVVYSVVSGRKMLEVVVLISFIYSIVYKQGRFNLSRVFSRTGLMSMLGIILLILVLQTFLEQLSAIIGIDDILGKAIETIQNGFSEHAEGVVSRKNNTNALIDLWYQSPIWGSGLNSYAASSIASYATKWSYEVQYIAWLAQTGIIGMVFLFLPVLYIYKRLRLKGIQSRDNKYYALMIGFICFVAGGASNPLVYLVWPWSIALIYCENN